MPAALDIVRRALREAGVIGDGEDPSGTMGPDGFDTLNGMLDSWTIDDRYVYTRGFAVYALTNGQQSYPIGPTATAPFNVPRPTRIINANLVYPTGLRVPLEIIDDDQRMSIAMPALPPSLPMVLNYQRTFPNGNLWLWITPDSTGYSLELETDTLLNQFATLATAYSFPPGYYEAMVYSLAERFCSDGWGRSASPTVSALALAARMKIESLNLDPPAKQQCDPRAGGVRGQDDAQGFTSYTWIGSGVRFYR